MRKIFVILVVSMLLLSAPVALAEPKPADEYIPMLVTPDPGYSFDDWWIELNPDDGGNGVELPQGDEGVLGDPDPMADPYQGTDLYRGIPIGFNFKFFEGPAMGIPIYNTATPPVAVAWSLQLTNDGYDYAWVGYNGYLAFGEAVPEWEVSGYSIPWFELADHRAVPSPVEPNNLVIPYLTDLIIGDNDFVEVTSVAFNCTGDCDEGPITKNCPDKPIGGAVVSGPNGCVDNLPAECDPVTGYWVPCTARTISRPRGRLLYKTVGEEPNRKFVVEWANARIYDAGGLATFQVQLWEGNNAILFLYKDFKPMAFFEDPPHEAAFVLHEGLVHGVEDFYGQVGVGFAYFAHPTASPAGWAMFNPLDELSAVGFAPDAYMGVRPFVP